MTAGPPCSQVQFPQKVSDLFLKQLPRLLTVLFLAFRGRRPFWVLVITQAHLSKYVLDLVVTLRLGTVDVEKPQLEALPNCGLVDNLLQEVIGAVGTAGK
jgi:hypothetical protein